MGIGAQIPGVLRMHGGANANEHRLLRHGRAKWFCTCKQWFCGCWRRRLEWSLMAPTPVSKG